MRKKFVEAYFVKKGNVVPSAKKINPNTLKQHFQMAQEITGQRPRHIFEALQMQGITKRPAKRIFNKIAAETYKNCQILRIEEGEKEKTMISKLATAMKKGYDVYLETKAQAKKT